MCGLCSFRSINKYISLVIANFHAFIFHRRSEATAKIWHTTYIHTHAQCTHCTPASQMRLNYSLSIVSFVRTFSNAFGQWINAVPQFQTKIRCLCLSSPTPQIQSSQSKCIFQCTISYVYVSHLSFPPPAFFFSSAIVVETMIHFRFAPPIIPYSLTIV